MAGRKYSDEQRLELLKLVDAGVTIRQAALRVGASPDVGYRWVKRAGLSTSRSTPTYYSDQVKEQFLSRLREVGIVSKVAREMGINRVTCYAWAHKAGIFTSDRADKRKQAFLALRAEGVSRVETARQLGVDSHQALDWDKGIRSFAHGRVYPDGRVVLYIKMRY